MQVRLFCAAVPHVDRRSRRPHRASSHADLLHAVPRSHRLRGRVSARDVHGVVSGVGLRGARPERARSALQRRALHPRGRSLLSQGGGAPPVWARANGVDSVVLGITFMEELPGVFVRTEDSARSVADLAGRRLGLPVWPRLVFNFWRFAASKGQRSALAVHGMRDEDVEFVDIVEGWDPHERRNVGRSELARPARCEYRGQLEALLAGEVDAIFGKGPEAALLQREAGGGFASCTTFARRARSQPVSTTPRLVC